MYGPQISFARKGQILFCKKNSDSTKKFSQTDIINMLEFLIDNIFTMLGGRVFQQTVATYGYKLFKPLLADLLLYSYGTDFIQGLLKKNEKKQELRCANFSWAQIGVAKSVFVCAVSFCTFPFSLLDGIINKE